MNIRYKDIKNSILLRICIKNDLIKRIIELFFLLKLTMKKYLNCWVLSFYKKLSPVSRHFLLFEFLEIFKHIKRILVKYQGIVVKNAQFCFLTFQHSLIRVSGYGNSIFFIIIILTQFKNLHRTLRVYSSKPNP